MLMMVPRSAVCADRIMEVLDTESSVVPPADPVTEVAERGTLVFDDVEFTYPGADVPGACATSPSRRGPARRSP